MICREDLQISLDRFQDWLASSSPQTKYKSQYWNSVNLISTHSQHLNSILTLSLFIGFLISKVLMISEDQIEADCLPFETLLIKQCNLASRKYYPLCIPFYQTLDHKTELFCSSGSECCEVYKIFEERSWWVGE